jgi:hypothetical protein
MRSSRITSLVLLAAAIAGGFAVQRSNVEPTGDEGAALRAGVALPAARPEPSLTSTWYCAGGTASADGVADHVVVVANPTDQARAGVLTVLPGLVAPAPAPPPGPADAGAAPTTTPATDAPTTTAPRPAPVVQDLAIPAQSRIEIRLGDVAPAPLAGAIVEVDGANIVVEHHVTGQLGRATAPCSTTASASWSFPWGVTERGARELLVFMNPFPDDATVDISFATDEGVRDTARFQGFVVPGRSVVGAYIDEDVTRKAQVSAQVEVRGGRLVVDRIQSFDGTDGRSGITLGLGVPTPAETWMFPTGETGPGLGEQIVVFNPSDSVAEVEVEARLDAPETNGTPEPFELTVPPGRYSTLDLGAEERVTPGVGHALFVRSLNGVAITAERVNTAVAPAPRQGVAATSGSPFGAATWYFAAGGPTAERDEYIVILNESAAKPLTYSVTGLAAGQTVAIQDLQAQSIAPGGRAVIRLGDKISREDLPLVITADGPMVVERGLYRIGGLGISQSIGVPLALDLVIPDPVDG